MPFRELLRECPGIPRVAPRMAFSLRERFFFKRGVVPRFLTTNHDYEPYQVTLASLSRQFATDVQGGANPMAASSNAAGQAQSPAAFVAYLRQQAPLFLSGSLEHP